MSTRGSARPLSSYAGRDEGDGFIMDRLWNPGGNGSGTALPPLVRQGISVPYPQNFRVVGSSNFFGGTYVTVSWKDIQSLDPAQIDRYEIYASNLYAANKEPSIVGTSAKSPCVCRLLSDEARNTVLRIRTVLKNGYANPVLGGPSATLNVAAPALAAGDIPDGTISPAKLTTGTRGKVWIYGAGGLVDSTGPGDAGQALVSNGSAADPTFQTIQQLRSTTKTANFTADQNYDVYRVTASTVNIVVTLPAVASRTTAYYFQKTDATRYTVALTPAGTETINGVNEPAIIEYQHTSVALVPVSGGWIIV